MVKNNGITIIALVVTVIILLIMAAVAVSMITGKEEIFNITALAKEKYETASEEEKNELDANLNYINLLMNDTPPIELGPLHDVVATFFENYEYVLQNINKSYSTSTRTATDYDKSETMEIEENADYLYLTGSNYDINVYYNEAYIYALYNGNKYYFLENGVYNNKFIIPKIAGKNQYEIHYGWKNYHTNAYVTFSLNQQDITKYDQNKDLINYIDGINDRNGWNE